MEQGPISLTQELDAMAALGQVLGNLTDPAARHRVLNWAAERFALEMPAATPATPIERQVLERAATDPGLAVDSLDDMFSSERQGVDGDLGIFEPSEPEPSKAPIQVVLRSFAADFQRFTEEWNGASA